MLKNSSVIIKFIIAKQEDGELIAYFEYKNQKYSWLSISEVEQVEYYVGDSPYSDTISGHVDFHLLRNELIKSACPYEIKLHANLVRNQASSDIYKYVDRILKDITLALSDAVPIQIDIQNELENVGWFMYCA